MFVVTIEGEITPRGRVPYPGESFYGHKVLASAYINDDWVGLLLLRDIAPYYMVCEVHIETYNLLWFTHFPNIVPATQEYVELTGCW